MKKQEVPKELLESLYLSGKSMPDIAKHLKCSVHKVVYWMTKHGITRRTWSESVYLKRNPKGDPFKIIENFTLESMFLFGLGLGIYWGEGEKASEHRVRVANTDPALLRMYRKFLLEICQLEEKRLSYSIICFNDSNPEEAKLYWAKELTINPNKFGKIVQIAPQGKGTYKRKSQYGVCTLTVGSITLKIWLLKQFNELKELSYLPT